MNFPEAQLSDPVCAWLRAQGLRVYVEVPWFGRAIDVVGVNGAGRIVAVELKQGLGHAVIRQAHQVQSSTWETYCAVRRKPRADGEHFERCRRYGIGVLLVDPSAGGEAVRVLIEPRDTGAVFGASAGRLLCRCEHMAEGGTGGMPNTLGNGPAQAVLRAVREFRRSNPGTNWREIYDKVPNHYASARSMQGALRNIEKWKRIKANRAEQRSAEQAGKAITTAHLVTPHAASGGPTAGDAAPTDLRHQDPAEGPPKASGDPDDSSSSVS